MGIPLLSVKKKVSRDLFAEKVEDLFKIADLFANYPSRDTPTSFWCRSHVWFTIANGSVGSLTPHTMRPSALLFLHFIVLIYCLNRLKMFFSYFTFSFSFSFYSFIYFWDCVRLSLAQISTKTEKRFLLLIICVGRKHLFTFDFCFCIRRRYFNSKMLLWHLRSIHIGLHNGNGNSK